MTWADFGLRLLAGALFWLFNVFCFYLSAHILKSHDRTWKSAARSSLAFAVVAFVLSYLNPALAVLSAVLLFVALLYLVEEYYAKSYGKMFLFVLLWLAYWLIILSVFFVIVSFFLLQG